MDDPRDLTLLEYPRHVHLPSVPGEWRYRVVRDHHECARALAEGYTLALAVLPSSDAGPPPRAAPSAPVEPEPEPAPVVLKPKGGWPRGRPRKVQP